MNNTNVSFVQLPFRQFVQMFPEYAEILRQTPVFDMFMNDPHYIVRLRDGKLEIGYTEDAWQIS